MPEGVLKQFINGAWVEIPRVSAHGDLTGLLNDDHTIYLLITGTRAMTGDLKMGDNDIINIKKLAIGTSTPDATYQAYIEDSAFAGQRWCRIGGTDMILGAGLNFCFIGSKNDKEVRYIKNDIPRMILDGDNMYFGTNLAGGAGTAPTRTTRKFWVDGANNLKYTGKGTRTDGMIESFNNEITTANATQTTLKSFTLEDENTYQIEMEVIGVKSDGSDRASYKKIGTFYRTGGGGATIQGTVTTIHNQESDLTWASAITTSGNNVIITVTGKAATTIQWVGYIKLINMSN